MPAIMDLKNCQIQKLTNFIQFFNALLCCMEWLSSGQNYSRSLVMTDKISNLTKQSFPEIHRNG